ncbi:MAG: DUF1269 domain-containing protein [Gammaproteobacteria bacterium]|nr:DUF1269 domain-containing protein [Gammaproteobacteria bacterium]
MKRLYFLMPDIDTTKQAVNDLLIHRIPEKDIHVIAKHDELLEQENIPKAGPQHETDMVPAMQRGVAAGGVTGLLAGLTAVTLPPAGLALGGGAVLATSLAGAGFGAVVAPMIGISLPNSRLKQFEDAVNDGQYLMLVDTPPDKLEEITETIRNHHPEVDIEGTEPTVPPFP